jgi:nucleotide-binding universal stress UspA family protein
MSGGPILLCYDGSEHAAAAIATAATVLAARDAVVVTVWESLSTWEPYDPAGLIGSSVATLSSEDLGLDEIPARLGREQLDQGVELARAAGFNVIGRLADGKPWHAICELAGELDASVIVLGARGLSRVKSALLGSVSAAVSVHAKRPVLVIPGQGSDATPDDSDAAPDDSDATLDDSDS